MSDQRRPGVFAGAVCAALVLLAALVYGQVRSFEFTHFDDHEYVADNPQVVAGLTGRGVAWAIASAWSANWHPVTWISHMLDVELFGVSPRAHHLVNAGVHAVAAAALFLFVRLATGALWRSAMVAALFAVHPINVESVAWISQRKSTLSTLFLFLALAAWVAYARRGGAGRYALAFACALLGLLAKPMLVTLPLLLFLVDRWPLDREKTLRAAAREKAPLIAAAAACAVATFVAQSRWAATASFPLGERLLNAPLSALLYLRDAVWPVSLACFYPHPAALGEHVNRASAIAAAGLLVGVSYLVWRLRRSRPHLLFGWAWYLVTLLPVLGIVQVGSQARADRYAYVPLVGIFVALVWETADVATAWRMPRAAAAAAFLGLVAVLAVVAHSQAATWHDDETLNARAIAVTRRNWLAWNNRGMYWLDAGDAARALPCFAESARAKPDYADAWYNGGVSLLRLGRLSEAATAFRTSVRLDPNNADGWGNLGVVSRALGDARSAADAFRRVLALRPGDQIADQGLASLGR